MTEYILYMSDDKAFSSRNKSQVVEYEKKYKNNLLQRISKMKRETLPELSKETLAAKARLSEVWNSKLSLKNALLASERLAVYIDAVRRYKEAQSLYRSAREKLATFNAEGKENK